MPTRMSIPVPADYRLARDLCSYGYFLLEPNRWDPRTGSFITTLDLADGAVTFTIRQGRPRAQPLVIQARYDPDEPGPDAPGTALTVIADRDLLPVERREARGMLGRILRLDDGQDQVAAFHAVDPRFAACGRGRLMRSATVFEDVVKTVTSCNVTWPSTVAMNTKLCRVFGRKSSSGLHAFPSAARLARAHPATLRARCSVGYRDARIVELAKIWRKPVGWIDDGATGDDDLFKALQDLPGVGPYAAANIMQLLGRYARLPLDTESIRHGRTVLGLTGSAAQVMKRVQRHFEPFGEHRFRSYWFELWRYYEAKRGHAWTWDRERTGKTFTAALLD